MTSIDITTITRETRAIINISAESELHKLLQVLHGLGYIWGGGAKALDHNPVEEFRPLSIWLENNHIYYDIDLDAAGVDLKFGVRRGRKKKYPRVPVPANKNAVYALASLHKITTAQTIPELTINELLAGAHGNNYRVKLLPFKPGRTIYVGPNMIQMEYLGEINGGYNYTHTHAYYSAHISHKGVILASSKDDWIGSTVYCAPKIAAVYAAQRTKPGASICFAPTEFDDYFKQKKLIHVGDRLHTLYAGLITRTNHRINDKIYFKLPSSFPQKPETGVHLSTIDDKLLAYYPTPRHILNDIPQRIKPGRYLKKYFPDMSDDDIRTHAAKITAGSGLQFFSSSEDMYRIYTELKDAGVVESCMSKDRWDKHPLDAYHESDVELAVMYEYGEPKARALYNKQNKHFPMIYGHWEKMQILLEQAGFKHATMCGAKINKIIIGNNKILMPYIDSKRPLSRTENKATSVDVCSDHCIISDDGEYIANRYEEGYIWVGDEESEDENLCECEYCGDYYQDGESYYVAYNNRSVCEHCYDNNTVQIYVHGQFSSVTAIHDSDFIEINGNYYADNSAAEYHDFQYVDDGWYHIDDLVFVEDLDEHVIDCEVDLTVFRIGGEYYSIDWILNNLYIEDDGNDTTTTETACPIHDAKTIFSERPMGISPSLWDVLPEPTTDTAQLTEAA